MMGYRGPSYSCPSIDEVLTGVAAAERALYGLDDVLEKIRKINSDLRDDNDTLTEEIEELNKRIKLLEEELDEREADIQDLLRAKEKEQA